MGKADELDSLFSAEEAKRRREDRAAMVERAAEQNELLAKAEAKRQEMAREFLSETNERARLDEYRRAGVEPPIGNKCSLSLLRSLGWTIEEIEGRRVLVRPPRVDPPPRREREQS